MKSFCIWISDNPPNERRQKCIDSILEYFPKTKILTEKDCSEYLKWCKGNLIGAVCKSDYARIGIMSDEPCSLYLDTDNMLKGDILSGFDLSKPIIGFNGQYAISNILYNGENTKIFSNLKKTYANAPAQCLDQAIANSMLVAGAQICKKRYRHLSIACHNYWRDE